MDGAQLRMQLAAHHREAFGWALSLCRYDAAEAEEVLQTAYFNLLARDTMFSGRSSFRTWLFAVIRKTTVEMRRRHWLQRLRLVAGDAGESAADPAPPPEERIQEDQRSRSLRTALAGLPHRQREVLQLVFYHDLSIAEAAQVMTVSIGSARRHYERAKQRLRERLAGVSLA